MTDHRATVSFIGESVTAQVEPGLSVIDAAWDVGVEITATCGKRGRCRSCRIKQVKGNDSPPTLADQVQLGEEELQEGYRLACQCLVTDDLTVQVAPPRDENSFQILLNTEQSLGDDRLALDSGIRKTHINPAAPEEGSSGTSYVDALLQDVDIPISHNLNLDILRKLQDIFDSDEDGATVTSFDQEVMSITPGDTTGQTYGIAFDIGTTTIAGYLVDLGCGEVLSQVANVNPQSVHGGDLMSRIAYAMESPANVRKMRKAVAGCLNDLIEKLCEQAAIARDLVYKVTVVGNTCMHHLFLGIDPTPVGQAPYVPVIRESYCCKASECGLRVNADARLFLLPIIAGFVGADTMGVILSTAMDKRQGISVAIDIGTNAEAVLSDGEQILVCSSPAGPALEGGHISSGMRAAMGAIDHVEIVEDVEIRTIGSAPPIGICGSGLIDAVATFLDNGIVDLSGRMCTEPEQLPEALRSRIRINERGMVEYVLVYAAESGNNRDIVISQGDVRQLQLAKAAIKSGLGTLLQSAKLGEHEIDELLLAGGFGNYLNLESAKRIGLIPDIPLSKIHYVANAAGLGAQMALLSEDERKRADQLSQQIEHVELSVSGDFQQHFLDAIPFPELISNLENIVVAKNGG